MSKAHRPLIFSARPAYLDAISIKGRREDFSVLPPASTFSQMSSSIDFGVFRPASLGPYLEQDPHALPVTADREGYYGDGHFDWWLSGLNDYLRVKDVLAKNGANLSSGDELFELGCASGRVLRHFACHEPKCAVWGADINLRHVEWVRQFLPQRIRIFQNTILPQLPIADGTMSLVCAFSVFTHIDDMELAWICELRRILKPGGIAYLTIHSEHTWQRLGPGLPVYDALISQRDKIADYRVSAELFKQPMPEDKMVFCWDASGTYSSNVFHSTNYIRDTWGRFMEIKEIIVGGHSYQDVVVMMRGD
ncbi:MAG: class I SAM-dependent methyltransferase [Dongiaceae bacterium]